MKIGEKIAKARKNANLTQDQLAELLEVTRQTVSKWESNLSFPETAKIAKLAQVLKISCDYLLTDNKTVTTEAATGENDYAAQWAKLYPILGTYQSVVDCEKYNSLFTDMINQMMVTYSYNLEDTVLVLKDLMYQSFLKMQKDIK